MIHQHIMTDEQPKETPTLPRQHERPRHRHYREQPRHHTESTQKPREAGGIDDEETDEERAVQRSRPRRGGRPEKKVYEEWASDPYCE